jgi:TolB-like protein
MGDGVLLEFPSVVAAVEGSIAIQKMMAERNAALPEAKRILYCVGVKLGDILIEGDDILGDGVNVAARLEGICEPGGVCLSGSAYDQVRGRIEAEFVDLGEQALKNIAQPVLAYALTPIAIAAAKAVSPPSTAKSRGVWARWPALAAALALVLLAAGAFGWRAGYAPRFMAASVDDKLANAPRLSIVVLPFENLSGDKDQDYFADGITDDLTTDLSHLPDSFVISRGTAFTYKGKPIDAKQIGRELGVRYLLEGSLRRFEDKITVNAQLISTETGAHVWADRFDGERSRFGQLQVKFVSRLANSLGVELVKAEALRAARRTAEQSRRSRSRDAGLGHLLEQRRRDPSDRILRARALQLDPSHTGAPIGLAQALFDRFMWSGGGIEAVDLPRAEALVASALSAEPNNASAHLTKANLFTAKRQFNDQFAEVDAAISKTIETMLGHTHGVEYFSHGSGEQQKPSRRRKLRSG